MHVYIPSVCGYLLGAEEGVRFPEAKVTGDMSCLAWMLGTKLSSLEEQQVLLATELSFHPWQKKI